MKILLFGKNGQVGYALSPSLCSLGELFSVNSSECDLRDEITIRRIIKYEKPDVIINAAAYTSVDKAETEKSSAFAVNANAPGVIAQEAESLGSFFIHYSTEYVFDGTKKESYIENDEPNPQSVYGETKLEGDRRVRALCSRHLILRTSWVAGVHGNNFAKTILRLASERNSLSVVDDQYGAPTSALLLADMTSHLIRHADHNPNDFPYGLYNVVASGSVNWYEYACHIISAAHSAGKLIDFKQSAIKAISSNDYPTQAKRPHNSRLDTNKFRSTFGLDLPHWQDGIDHILRQILSV